MWSGKSGGVARNLRTIYDAATLSEAEQAFQEFPVIWDTKYPTISANWRRDWEGLTVFFGYPPEIRKMMYTIMRLSCSIIRYGKCSIAEVPFPPMNQL